MHITTLELQTGDLPAQRAFYTTVLELPLVEEGATFFRVRVGTTLLTFTTAVQPVAMYHLAFNIPRGALAQARTWLRGRGALLADNVQSEVYFPAWDAYASYFYDAAGNLLEVIDRRTLVTEERGHFGREALLCVSEIGLTVHDVAGSVAALTARANLAPYSVQSENFAPLGDEHGLILVAAVGRSWTPTVPAAIVPVNLTLRDGAGRKHHLARLPGALLGGLSSVSA